MSTVGLFLAPANDHDGFPVHHSLSYSATSENCLADGIMADFPIPNVILAPHRPSLTRTVAIHARLVDLPAESERIVMEDMLGQQTVTRTAVLREEGTGLRPRTKSTTTCHILPGPRTHVYRGHYSDAVLSSLESQNDAEVEGISAKVKMLKNVSPCPGVANCPELTGGHWHRSQ